MHGHTRTHTCLVVNVVCVCVCTGICLWLWCIWSSRDWWYRECGYAHPDPFSILARCHHQKVVCALGGQALSSHHHTWGALLLGGGRRRETWNRRHGVGPFTDFFCSCPLNGISFSLFLHFSCIVRSYLSPKVFLLSPLSLSHFPFHF